MFADTHEAGDLLPLKNPPRLMDAGELYPVGRVLQPLGLLHFHGKGQTDVFGPERIMHEFAGYALSVPEGVVANIVVLARKQTISTITPFWQHDTVFIHAPAIYARDTEMVKARQHNGAILAASYPKIERVQFPIIDLYGDEVITRPSNSLSYESPAKYSLLFVGAHIESEGFTVAVNVFE